MDLEKEKKELEEKAKEMDTNLQKRLKTVGNYVHDDVPISDNEVLNVAMVSMQPVLTWG